MNKLFVVLIVGTILFYLGSESMFIVPEGKQAIVIQVGKPVGDSITQAGLYFKTPLIQEVKYFEKRILKLDGDPNEIPTNDKTFIWIDTTARWQIVDPLLFYQRVQDTRRARIILSDLINGAVRDFVTKNLLIEVIRSSDWKKEYTDTQESGEEQAEAVKIGRDRFSQIVLESVADVSKDYGIVLLDVLVKRLNYINDVRKTVYERMISERKQIAAKIRSSGEAEKSEIEGEIERRLDEVLSEARKTSEQIRGKADAKATKIYSYYKIDPSFYEFYTSLETYKKTIGKNTSLVIQTDSPIYKFLKKY